MCLQMTNKNKQSFALIAVFLSIFPCLRNAAQGQSHVPALVSGARLLFAHLVVLQTIVETHFSDSLKTLMNEVVIQR